MKIPAYFLASFLALAIGSCSSETEELIVPSPSNEREDLSTASNSNVDGDQTEPWIVDEDDNRTRFDSCDLSAPVETTATSITITWSEPANASIDIRYRIQVATDEEFTNVEQSLANLTETSHQINNLKPNTEYHIRLQAYVEPGDDNSTPEELDGSSHSELVDFAPSEPETVQATTLRNPLLHPTGIELTIEYGKFSAKWDPPSNASGKLEYMVGLHTDETLQEAVDLRMFKEPMIKEWIVTPEQDYWLKIQALPDPDSTNQGDSDSPPLIKHFRVPGNQLNTPDNFTVTTAKDIINLSWDPINNNSQNFEYLLMVYLDEERSEAFGEYHLNVPRESISSVNQNPRYWFDLQAVPVTGNHSDVDSEIVSSFLELPAITYATPKISAMNLEPINDPEEPGTIIKLSWARSATGDGQHKYRIEIADDEDFQIGFQDYEEDADSVGGEYGPLDPGKTFYMRMRAVGPPEDATRINSEWSEVRTFVTPGAPPPSPPEE